MDTDNNLVALPEYDRRGKRKTNGQIFKEKHGYSKTMKRLAKKYEVTVEEYRVSRKKKRRERAVDKKQRHMKVIAGRKTKAEMQARRAARKKKK